MTQSNQYYENTGNREIYSAIPDYCKYVLDIGCGAGSLGKNSPHKNVFWDGITISEKEAESARQIYRNVLLHNAENGLPISCLCSSYDVCICSHVIEHIFWPQALLKDIRSLLAKSNGILIMALPNAVYYNARMKIMRGKFEYRNSGIFDYNHTRWYTFKTGKELLIKNGFTVSKSWTEGKFPLGNTARRKIPRRLMQSIDRLSGRLWPGLFGYQLLYTAKTQSSK